MNKNRMPVFGVRIWMGMFCCLLVLSAARIALSGEGEPAGRASAREPGTMKVLSAKPHGAGLIRVETTAAYFDFDPKENTISITCRLTQEQSGGKVSVGAPLKGLKVANVNQDICTLSADAVEAQVDFGSILKLSAREPFAVACPTNGPFEVFSFGDADTAKKKFTRWYVCVQPARKFDWMSFYNDRMVQMGQSNEKPYAGTQEIKMARDCYDANILLFWSRIWNGYWWSGSFEAWDDAALKSDIDAGHRLGMRVIAYTQEFPGGRGVGGFEGFLKRMVRAKEVYGFDGLYFDGLAAAGTTGGKEMEGGWENSYVLLREARRLFRDGILVMHLNPGCLSVFLDYVHWGEHKGSYEADVFPEISRHAQKGWAIGAVIENAEGMNESLVDEMLKNNVILRFGLIDAYCDQGFLPGTGAGWDMRFFRLYRDYFLPKLQLKGLAYKRRNNLIDEKEFSECARKLKTGIQEYMERNQMLTEKGKIPLGLKPVKVAASSVIDPQYNTWLCRETLAVDGSTTSGVWLGGKAKPGTTIAHVGGKPEDGIADWLRLDFGKPVKIHRILYDTTCPGFETAIWQEAFTISGSLDGKTWTPLVEKKGLEKPERFQLSLAAPAELRYLQVHNILSRFRDFPLWRMAYVTEIQAYEPEGPGSK